MSIGQRISELRKSNALSQEYVAERLGVTRQAVSKWETNQSAPDTYNLIALAELFGVSVEYIATGKQPEQLRPPDCSSRIYIRRNRMANSACKRSSDLFYSGRVFSP